MTEVAPAANGGELAVPAKTADAPAKATESTGEKTEPIAAAVTEETEKKLTVVEVPSNVVDESASSPTKTSPTHRLKNIWTKTWKKMSSLKKTSTTPVGKPTSSDADKGEATEQAKEEEVKSGEKKKESSEAATRETLEEGKEKVQEEEKLEDEDKEKVEESGEQVEEVKEGAEEEDRKNFWGTVRKWFAQFRRRPATAAVAKASSSEAKREAIAPEEKDQVAKADEAKEEAIQPSKVEGSEECKENLEEVAEKVKEETETKVGSKEAVVEEVPGQPEGPNTIWARTRKAFAHFRRKSNVVAAGETSKAEPQKEGVFLEGEANGKKPQEQPKEEAKEELKAEEAKSSDVATAPREGLKPEEANESIAATGSKEKGEEPLVKSIKEDEKAEDTKQGDSKDALEKEVEKQSAAVAKDEAPLGKEDGGAKTAEEPVKKEGVLTETKASESKEASNEEKQKPAAKPVQEEVKSVDLKQQELDQAPKKEEPKSTEEPVKDEAKVEAIKGTE